MNSRVESMSISHESGRWTLFTLHATTLSLAGKSVLVSTSRSHRKIAFDLLHVFKAYGKAHFYPPIDFGRSIRRADHQICMINMSGFSNNSGDRTSSEHIIIKSLLHKKIFMCGKYLSPIVQRDGMLCILPLGSIFLLRSCIRSNYCQFFYHYFSADGPLNPWGPCLSLQQHPSLR